MIDVLKFLRQEPNKEKIYPLSEYSPSAHIPESVRVAMSAQDGKLFPKDLEPMIDSLPVEATYYLLKLSHGQYNYDAMQKIIAAFLNATDRKTYQSWLKEALSTIPPDASIKGSKPFSISRYGFDTYQSRWKSLFEKHEPTLASEQLCILGLSPIIGLRQILPLLQKTNASVLFAILNRKEGALRFFRITPGNPTSVTPLEKDAPLPDTLTLIDDVQNTGETSTLVEQLFAKKYPATNITFTSLVDTGNGKK